MQLHLSDQSTFEVYFSGDENADKGIIIFHDWWGIQPYNHDWAEWLNEQGYATLIVDLYDGVQPQDPAEAGEYMRSLDQNILNEKISVALDFFQQNNRKIGLLGWSFGGLQVQQALLSHPSSFDAAAFYYCRLLSDDERWASVKASLLSVYAETERTWPEKQEKFEDLVDEVGLVYQGISYNASHGFVNQTSAKYNEASTLASKCVLADYFSKVFN